MTQPITYTPHLSNIILHGGYTSPTVDLLSCMCLTN